METPKSIDPGEMPFTKVGEANHVAALSAIRALVASGRHTPRGLRYTAKWASRSRAVFTKDKFFNATGKTRD